MADIFCDDGGSNTAPYETWAAAATTFLVAVDAASAGDRLMIGHDHNEDPGGSVTYAFPGTAASPNVVLSALSSAGGSTVTYTVASGVQLDTDTSGNFDIVMNGHAHVYGFNMIVGDDFISSGSPARIILEDCEIELTGTSSNVTTGSASGQNVFELRDTDLNYSGGGASSGFSMNSPVNLRWSGGTISWSGTQPTALFDAFDEMTLVHLSGVDLSAISSALVDVSSAGDINFEMHHCLLHASVALTTGTIASQGTTVLMSGCDDSTGNDLYRLEYVDFWGSTVHDDAIFRDDGASDGDNPISWKMVSTANAVEFSVPTKSPPIYSWIDATGSTTFTVNLNWDSASDLQDDEVWLEIEFLEASADTDSAFADDRMTDITSTPADQDNNSEAWTGTSGFSNENQQEVAVTATVNRVGPVIARVCLAKPSTTIYVDPLIVKS